MKKNERKLTEKELKRKEQFEILRADMQKNGYKEKALTIGVLQANVGAIIIMLPFVVVTAMIYYNVNSIGAQEISLRFSILLLPILLVLIVLHELIHGLVWGYFAKNHFHSIEFGVIWKALTPYCTCSEPMKKWQYMLGGAMPTLALGAGTAVIAVATSQWLLFLIAELMIFSGGGDSLIILKILLYRSRRKETMKSRYISILKDFRTFPNEYIGFLRKMFKGTEPTKYISLAYLTGILPIKKLKTQSALNNFDEFTMLDAGEFAPFVGFTEDEVEQLSIQYDRNFPSVEQWYDGYLLSGQHVYNPKAVVSVMKRGIFQSYWSKTGTFESIRPFINMDFDGLKTAIIKMISGDAVTVDTSSFQNDMVSFESKDDVLTLLIHMGYLAYDQKNNLAFIPNEEVRQEFISATKKKNWNELVKFEQQSNDLLNATLDMEEEKVAAGIEKIHTEYVPSVQYNDENSLSSVLTIAYLSSMQYYFKPVRELPTGRGFADFVYIPKPEYLLDYPALVVELKWNKSTDTALKQIKEKKYPESLLQYTGNILIVGISYNKKTKAHQCAIEEFKK